MLAVGSAAWALYERVSRVQAISSWITYLLPYQDPRVVRLLQSLGRRVDAVAEPLNYVLLWSADKGSCVSGVVYQARDVLCEVERFVHRAVRSSASGAKKPFFSDDATVAALEGHIRELDFCLSSVTMAVSLVQASGAGGPPPRAVSGSALLRASGRVTEMLGMGGDVSLSYGSFYARRRARPKGAAASGAAPAPAPADPAESASPDGGGRMDDSWEDLRSGGGGGGGVSMGARRQEPEDVGGGWWRIERHATLKLFHNVAERRFEARVLGGAAGSEPHVFDLRRATRFQSANSPALGMMDRGDSRLTGVVDVGFAWRGGGDAPEYAFMLHGLERQCCGPGNLRPIDIVYAARLCAYENESRRAAGGDGGNVDDGAGDGAGAAGPGPGPGSAAPASSPHHAQASDEELAVLLAEPLLERPPPPPPPPPPARVSPPSSRSATPVMPPAAAAGAHTPVRGSSVETTAAPAAAEQGTEEEPALDLLGWSASSLRENPLEALEGLFASHGGDHGGAAAGEDDSGGSFTDESAAALSLSPTGSHGGGQ